MFSRLHLFSHTSAATFPSSSTANLPVPPPGRGGQVTQCAFFRGRMPKCEGKQLHFDYNFETLEVDFWAVQKLAGLAAARSCALSSPGGVSRITGPRLFAEVTPKIPGPSLVPQKAQRESCCHQAQPSCSRVNAEQFLQKLG